MEKIMKFKVVFLPNIQSKVKFEKKFETLSDAEIAFDAIADYTLLLHKSSLMVDYSNMGYIEKKSADGYWEEIED